MIFEAYARCELEDDDEVAVSHEAAEHGYRPTSEALVNLRATLTTAVRDAVLSESAAGRLIVRQKSQRGSGASEGEGGLRSWGAMSTQGRS